ncbi:MAG: DNA gyrase subunit A [Candidatus Babeliales bacterium]
MSATKDQINNKRVEPILIEDELKNSFLDYAMSVIVSRALPDVRDGLKPVHRRILYSMNQSGFHYNRPYHKSVRIVGDVLGKYHPHGDSAVYNSMVGMVQDFSKRYPLLDGQGNWGSVDGDSPAAMRYTEIRMQKISQEILADLDKATVPFVPNFDESTVEPVILPSRLPNLLVNGTTGIAVGMATSIPPHNLREIIDACLAFLENEDVSDDEILRIVQAPDFPTGGIICGRAGIVKAYKTGRGSLTLRGVAQTEETKKGSAIVITELPFQVNKAELIIKIADLVKNKVIEGISNLRDESDKKGMRLVIELKRGEIPQVTLNQLYKFTTLQQNVTILMLGLLDNKPIIFSLRELIREFVYHRQEVVYKRTIYDLEKAKQREHILHGFVIALDNIDELVALIKKSESPEIAIEAMNMRFKLSTEQAKAILEMRLQRLTGLEQEKIRSELGEIKVQIAFLNSIIQDKAVLIGEVKKELNEVRELYGDERRTRIEGPIDILTEADLIPEEDVVVTLTRKGYIKRVQLSTYGVQHRGGKGKMAMTALDEGDDMVLDVFVALTHDDLLFFTNLGRVYNLRVFEVPEASRMAKGRAIVNLLPLQEGEQVVKLLRARDLAGKSLVMLSKNGVIKRTEADQFEKIRTTGIRACSLKEGDELVFCALSSGTDTIVIATAKGAGIRFKEDEVRVMGRQAAGVRGIRLRKDDYVIGMQIIPADDTRDILFATSGGYGKRVKPEDFRVAHRGGYGVRTIPTDTRNGLVIGLAAVSEESNILLIDEAGKMIRLSPAEIRTMGRQAKGVRLIKLDKDQKLAAIVAFEEEAPNHDNENNDQHDGSGTKHVTGAVKADAVDDSVQPLELDPVREDDIKVVFDEPGYDDDYDDEDEEAEEEEVEDDVLEDDDTMVF